MMNLKHLAETYKRSYKLFCLITNFCFGFKKKRVQRGNDFKYSGAMLKRCKVVVNGIGNTIVIGNMTRLANCSISINGNDNVLRLDDSVFLNQVEFYIEDSKNKIVIGKQSSIQEKTQLSAIEGTSLLIGNECLLSGEVMIRTGDSHSLLDKETGIRINPSRNVVIEDHVWIGSKVCILKGSVIPKGCVVGAGSIVTKKFADENIVIVGNPARDVRKNISWCHERISIVGKDD